jgi:hypothetical protein
MTSNRELKNRRESNSSDQDSGASTTLGKIDSQLSCVSPGKFDNEDRMHSVPQGDELGGEQVQDRGIQVQGYAVAHNYSERLLPKSRHSSSSSQDILVRWTYDTFLLQVWSRIHVDKNWRPIHPWLALFLDLNSWSVPGLSLAINAPRQSDFLHTLRTAVLSKKNPRWLNRGLPNIVEVDHSREHRSQYISEILAELKIRLEYVSPFCPLRKGKLERPIMKLDRFLSERLPACAFGTFEAAQENVNALLSVDQLYELIKRFFVDTYHEETHP